MGHSRIKSQPNNSGRGASQRQLRVGELVRKALSEFFMRGDIPSSANSDIRVPWSLMSVTEVRMTPDLKLATVYLLPIGHENVDEIIKEIQTKEPFIRSRVIKHLHLKFAPRFKFEQDTSYDNYSQIDQLLKSPKVKNDLDDAIAEQDHVDKQDDITDHVGSDGEPDGS